jgi:hypothetical protein
MIPVGHTLLICTPPNNKEHLFIVIAAGTHCDVVLLVNITTPKIGCDNSCCINIGEHSFVTHTSVVNYADSRITPIANLEYCLGNGIFKKNNPVSKQLLRKIQDGALKSPDIREGHRNFLISYLDSL